MELKIYIKSTNNNAPLIDEIKHNLVENYHIIKRYINTFVEQFIILGSMKDVGMA